MPSCCMQFDLKNKRTFLKRTRVEGIALHHMRVGAKVLVYARQLEILGFADAYTKQQLDVAKERCALLPFIGGSFDHST